MAQLIVLTNAPNQYTYLIPDGMTVSVGDMVSVIFAQSQRDGLVTRVFEASPSDFSFDVSPIQAMHATRPSVPADLVTLMAWFRDYYCVTDYAAFQCIVGKKKCRDDLPVPNDAPLPLDPLSLEQQRVYDAICASNSPTHVIHGVTGSGKTQLYAHLIQTVVAQGRSVIMLIPEISLTPQFSAFFSAHFSKIGVIHSSLTPKKRDVLWNQCRNGQLDVIIGPRSAVFMPCPSLGMVIIDEEHDASYKQENAPRYYTQTVASQRCQYHGATLILGSATPSVSTYSFAQKNTSSYHRLSTRYNHYTMPRVTMLDMTTVSGLIHPHLLAKIGRTIDKKNRTLILVNRRGYSSYLLCKACGKVQECPDCQTSFTYHADGQFRCHRCETTRRMTRQCMHCQQFDVQYHGVAIQKVAMDIQAHFPQATITRIDRDTVQTMVDLNHALESVDEADILIGTQMIAKGHNFKRVALVGMIGVDTTLHFPDYRGSERLFQLITQMAGRAGRDMDQSEVLVQTRHPQHYVFRHAKTHDVTAFLDQEIQYRHPFGYPPFKAIINIIFRSKSPDAIRTFYDSVIAFNQSIMTDFSSIQIIGPKVAPIEKVGGYFRHNVFYKINPDDVTGFKQRMGQFPKHRQVRWVIDVDPLSLL